MTLFYRARPLATTIMILLGALCCRPRIAGAGLLGSDEPNLIPWPRSVEMVKGSLKLTEKSRIVATDPSLLPLARVLSEEIVFMTGLRAAAVDSAAQPGDIVLKLDKALDTVREDFPAVVCEGGKMNEAYTVAVGEQAVVTGGSYNSVALGTATILQLLGKDGGKVTIPKATLSDAPHSVYRSLLIDCARQTHSINTLKKIVVLCRFYKIRFLQLHLTDDQAFTFPSTAFPALATPERHYALEELHDLEKYASERGVSIIPELEVPGHASRMRAVKPFGGPPEGVINIGSEDLYPALDTLVGEICDVFKSTPYFHMGGDECWLEKLGETPEEKAYIKAHDLPYPHALYDHFIVRMNEIIRKHGKQTVLWEGFQGKGAKNCTIPYNIIVFSWETMYQTPDSLLNNGYTIVNAAWRPLYIVGDEPRYPENIYSWNLYLWRHHFRYAPSFIPIQLSPDTVLPDGSKIKDKVIGGHMSVWEQKEDTEEIPFLRYRLAAMSERIWNPGAGKTMKDFLSRLQNLDAKAVLLMTPVRFDFDGLTDPLANDVRHKEWWHNRPLKIAMTPMVAGTTVRYTTDGSVPSPTSSAYASPLTLTEPSTVLKAQAFDASGKPCGQMLWENYEYRAVQDQVTADGLLKGDGFEKGAKLRVTLAAPGLSGGTLRFATNAALSEKSAEYKTPIVIDSKTGLSAGYYDASNRLMGQAYHRAFDILGTFERSLTTGKPVTTSKGDKENDRPDFVCDGFVDQAGFWSSGPFGAWLQADLQKVHRIDRIHVVTYWDGGRYYQYFVEVSVDGKTWKRVIDRTKSTEPATERGITDTFDATPGRFIRLTVTNNSANGGVHVVELRAFEATK